MTTEIVPQSTTETPTEKPGTTLLTTVTSTTTHATFPINTTTVASTLAPSTSPWLNASTFSSTSLFSTTSNLTTITDPTDKSHGNVAIICGVIFGVLGLAIALVACYIIVRKVKENKERNRRSLQYDNSERKPYDRVQRDFDSDHDYKGMSSDITATNIEAPEAKEGNGKIGNYENINIQSNPVYSNREKKHDDTIEIYEPVTNPDRQSQIYIEMSIDPTTSKQISSADAKLPAKRPTVNSSKENLSFETPPYANIKSVSAENIAKKSDISEYANAPNTLTNGQSRLSLKTEDTTKTKKHKGSKKKNKYDINSGSVADLDDITYKL